MGRLPGIYALIEVEKDDIDDAVKIAKGGVTQYNEDEDQGRGFTHCWPSVWILDQRSRRGTHCIN